MKKAQPTKNKPAFNLLTKYERNDSLVEEGKWITYLTEDGEETPLEFKIASLDSKEYQKFCTEFWRDNAQTLIDAQGDKAKPETIQAYLEAQKEVQLSSAAKHLLKGWRWNDEDGGVHDGELPWGDETLLFSEDNAIKLLSLKRANDTFLQYVVLIANDYQNYLAARLQGDIKN